MFKPGIHQPLIEIVFNARNLDIELVNIEVRSDWSHLMVNVTLAISLDIRQVSKEVGWYGMDMWIQIMMEIFSHWIDIVMLETNLGTRILSVDLMSG